MVFAGYSSHELTTIGTNVTKNKIQIQNSTPTEDKASGVSEHLCVGETKTANRVLQEIRTHFSRPVIG